MPWVIRFYESPLWDRKLRLFSLWIIKNFRRVKTISTLSVSHNKLLITAIKNQATGHYILNGKGEEVKSRSFIDLGVEWHYIIEEDVETLHTDGPLHDPVVVLVMKPPSLSKLPLKLNQTDIPLTVFIFIKESGRPSSSSPPFLLFIFFHSLLNTNELNLLNSSNNKLFFQFDMHCKVKANTGKKKKRRQFFLTILSK